MGSGHTRTKNAVARFVLVEIFQAIARETNLASVFRVFIGGSRTQSLYIFSEFCGARLRMRTQLRIRLLLTDFVDQDQPCETGCVTKQRVMGEKHNTVHWMVIVEKM